MEEIYENLKGTVVIHDKYQGVVCGYSESHFILAVETKDTNFFRILKKMNFFVEEQYKDPKYRYVFEDEMIIEKQIKERLWEQKK
jgi:hypothetical protein